MKETSHPHKVYMSVVGSFVHTLVCKFDHNLFDDDVGSLVWSKNTFVVGVHRLSIVVAGSVQANRRRRTSVHTDE